MAVLQGGVLNLACLFPPIYIQGFVVGAGLSGVGTSVLSFVTQLRAVADGDDGGGGGGGGGEGGARTAAAVAPAAFLYFSVAASVTAVCIAAFALLARLEFSRARLAAHRAALRHHHRHEDGAAAAAALLGDGGGGGGEGDSDEDDGGEAARRGLLSAPYEGQLPEEGEPLPAVERFWPAALIPYMHPATVAAERSAYWGADVAAEEGGGGSGGGGSGGGSGDGGEYSGAVVDLEGGGSGGGGGGGLRLSDAGAASGSGAPQPGAFTPPPRASAPVGVPGRRSTTSGGGSAASAPLAVAGGAGPSSYDSPGGVGDGALAAAGSSFRCGTALRFYRSGSASALKGMLEAAVAQQEAAAAAVGQLTPGGGARISRPGSGLDAATPGGGNSPAPRPRSSARGRRVSADAALRIGGGSGGGDDDPEAAHAGRRRPPSAMAAPAAGAQRDDKSNASQRLLQQQQQQEQQQHNQRQRPKHSSRAVVVADGAAVAAAAAAAARPSGAGPFVAYAAAIVVCMAGSLAVWPGVAAFICSAANPAAVSPCVPRAPPYGRLSGDLFVPLMFVVYALGDLTGRVASGAGPWGRRPPAPAALVAYALARLAVAGGLLACHVVTPAPWRLPYALRSDAWPLGLAVALGFTQGHLLSTACMHAPAVLPPGREARFGPVTGFCITAGCLAGSVASTAIVEAFTRPALPGAAPFLL